MFISVVNHVAYDDQSLVKFVRLHYAHWFKDGARHFETFIFLVNIYAAWDDRRLECRCQALSRKW